jgi:type IV pilus assembly protein PilV
MTSIKHINSLANRQRGVGMLEILVSVLVLAIGLLGLAALQSIGMKYNYQSLQRTQAVMLAYELTDRIRANSDARVAGQYTIAYGTDPGQPAAGTCQTVSCTSAEMAAFDLALWKESISDLLGDDADGQITYNAATLLHKIHVRWKENELDYEHVQEVEL